jgi:two-component system OmpR family response regulator
MAQPAIVVVDDTDTIRDVIRLMLEHNGYTVYSFANPADALAVSESIQIDLFIVDMVMPGISGLEFLKRLKVKEMPFEVVIVTGKDDKEDAAEAMKLGAFGVLQKPFSFAELLTSVEYALVSASAKKQQVGNLMDLQGNPDIGVEK